MRRGTRTGWIERDRLRSTTADLTDAHARPGGVRAGFEIFRACGMRGKRPQATSWFNRVGWSSSSVPAR